MQKTPAQLFKRWGEEKGADKYAKATKPVSDSATTLQHYCCCCLSYMGSLSISLSLFLSTWLALHNNNNKNVSSSSNSATLQMKRKFTNSIHEILLRWPTSTLTPPSSSSLWSSAPPSCWSSTSMQSHTQSADRNEWERERERREQGRALWIVRFATCFCASPRVASALSKAAQSPTACWLCSALVSVSVCGACSALALAGCFVVVVKRFICRLSLSPSLLLYSTESMEDEQRRILCKL